MKRISTIKNQVNRFLDGKDLSPLKFKDYEGKPSDSRKYSVDDMVLRTVTLTELYSSVNPETDKLITRNSRRRSSLDIWRHIIFFYPNITIFQVMKSLYNIQSKLYSNYCYDVKRRVFFKKQGNITTLLSGISNRDMEDEYGLLFEDWNMNVDINPRLEQPF